MSTLTATQLQQQYIAYFGRPGDPAGIKYWLSSSSGISSAREFADIIYAQDEYKTSTVGGKSTEAQINSLYQNLFGRDADPSGLIYWTGQIESGILSLSNLAYDLISSANNPVEGNEDQGAADALALTNKTNAAIAFTADIELSTSAILAYQPESTDPWTTGAAFESGKSYLAGITTTAHTETGIDDAVASMITADDVEETSAAGTTNKFTSTTDSLVGGSGDDKFNGVLQLTDAAAVTGTTIAPGDDVEGKGGTDTVAISVAGTQNTGYTLSAVVTTDVEKVLLSNFETSTNDTTVDASLMTGVTTLGLSSSSSTGDTIFSGVKNVVTAEMRNGAGDLTITYVDTVFSGESDTQNLTLSNITGGTFTANGAETVAITSELAKNTLTNFAATNNTTLNISGDKALTISTALTAKTIDASASTGGVNLNIGTATSTVTGGTGDDTIQFKTAQITKDDTIKGGAGTDTLKLAIGNATYDGESDTTGQELYGVSEFEVIDVDATHDNATVELDTIDAGIKTLVAGANTLIVTPLGDADDNGSVTIGFTLNGTSYTSASVDLSGDAAADLPLLTAALATKINSISGFEATDNSANVTITNTGSEEVQITVTDVASQQTYTEGTTYNVSFADAAADQVLDIYSGAIVKHRFKDASGTEDLVNVNLKSVSGDKDLDTTIEDLDIANTETLNLSASGKGSKNKFTLSDLSADASLTTLNITGSSDLVISDTATGNTKLVTVDAGAFTGDLTLATMSAGSDAKQTVTTGSGNDNVDFGANLTEDDVVDLGGNSSTTGGWQATTGKTGKDKLEATGNLGTATDDSVLQVSNVEQFELANTGTAATYIDASKMSNIGSLAFSATAGTVKIKNLEAGADIGLGVGTAELFGTLDVSLADSTGTEDSLGLVFSETVDGHDGTLALKTSGIETINITASKDATDAAHAYTLTTAGVDASKIVLTGGNTTFPDTYDLATLHKNTTTVDASALDGLLVIDGVSTGVATTVHHKGTTVATVTTSTGDDTIKLGTVGTVIHVIDVSTGTDTLDATLSSTASDFTSIDGVETFNLTIKDETAAGFDDATKLNGVNEATTVNILGGNALSSFTVTANSVGIVDDTASTTDNVEVIDASTFAGSLDLTIDPTAFDDTLTIKGPAASTSDVLRFDAQEADGKIRHLSGIETLSLYTSDGDLDGVVDLTNATGYSKIALAYTTNTNDDAVEFKKVLAGTTFRLTSTQNLDAITIGMADASTTTTAVDIELIDFENSQGDTIDINATGVETITINEKSADSSSEKVDLAGVTATTGSKTKLILKGGDLELAALSTSFNEIDASVATGGITLTAANRPSSSITITGGLGNDSFAMESSGDVLDGALGTDTLVLTGNNVIGGMAIDLSAADQVVQYAGVANSAIQQNFENVTASAITSAAGFGLDLTGSSKANTIIGSNFSDNITPGEGADTVTGGLLADFIDLTEATAKIDTVNFLAYSNNGIDEISGFDVTTDKIVFTGMGSTEMSAGSTALTKANATYDVGASAGDALAVNGAVYVDNTSDLIGTTDANVITSIIGGGTTLVVADEDSFYYVADNGTDTFIFHVHAEGTVINDGSDIIDHVGTIRGLAAAETLTAANFGTDDGTAMS